MPTNINQVDIATKSYKNCSKFKYRIRWFNSKGAGLILLWTILVSVSMYQFYLQHKTLLSGLIYGKTEKNLSWVSTFVVIVLFLVSAPISGWLADNKLGVYKIFKTGSTFLFIASVLASVLVLVLENLPTNSIVAPIASGVMAPFIYFFGSTGAAACFITALQLGIDQMPDASAVNITSYIAWFVFSFFAGVWITDVSHYEFSQYCLHNKSSFRNYDIFNMSTYRSNCSISKQTFTIFPVVCMTVVLCLDYILAKKWLIIEPNSTQSLKLIFRVLKFAAKHKSPVLRSAFTYWEENIPSRIDLGKSRYGGPFTTEQVEDVKTIFKLIVVSLPYSIIVISLDLLGNTSYNVYECSTSLCYFTYNGIWCALIGTMVYEFAIYPLLKNKLPSLLKIFGIVSFMIFATSIVSLSLSVVEHFDSTLSIQYIWNHIILQVMVGLLVMFSISVLFQFVCAQSPYNMRTLVTGCVIILLFSTSTVGNNLVYSLFNDDIVPRQHYFIVINSLATGLSFFGFVLHCLLARWYKGRVRDDIYTPHRLVEEVYDRYLSHQTLDYNDM